MLSNFFSFFVIVVSSFEIACWRTQSPHPSLSRKAARVNKRSEGHSCSSHRILPRPFPWERVGVRAISLSVGDRKIMNHFVVSHPFLFRLCCARPMRDPFD